MRLILITREIDYAVRIVRTLHRSGQQSATEIVDKEGIPMPFAYKILKKMSKGGLIQTFRGPSGGYRLLKSCEEMTLFDIIKALEDEILITECMATGYECTSNQSECCRIHQEFLRIQKTLEQELSAKKLSDLLKM